MDDISEMDCSFGEDARAGNRWRNALTNQLYVLLRRVSKVTKHEGSVVRPTLIETNFEKFSLHQQNSNLSILNICPLILSK